MKFYLHETDPIEIIGSELPKLASSWSSNPARSFGTGNLSTDHLLFNEFLERYQIIGVRNDSFNRDVRVVSISSIDCYYPPNLSNLGGTQRFSLDLIDHLNRRAATETYQYKKWSKNQTAGIKEEFFFPYKEEGQLKSFAELLFILKAVRYLSTILHKLSSFLVMLMDEGVFVQILAFDTADSAKPPFAIGL